MGRASFRPKSVRYLPVGWQVADSWNPYVKKSHKLSFRRKPESIKIKKSPEAIFLL